MNAKELIEALHSGQMVYGTLMVSPSPAFVDAVDGLDLDCIFIDTEHIPMDNFELGWMCQAYKALGMAPIVRIPSPDPYRAAQVLDTGASGIIAPYVETVEQVKQLRGAVKLRPLKGKKLQQILAGQSRPEETLADYLQEHNQSNALIVNIESVPAIEALDEILAVPGLDAVLIGPHDLSCSLGVPEQYDHPDFDKAMRVIIRKARAKSIGVGIHNCPSVEQEISLAKEGLNMILHFSDMVMFRKLLHHDLNILRQALGEEIAPAQLEDKPI